MKSYDIKVGKNAQQYTFCAQILKIMETHDFATACLPKFAKRHQAIKTNPIRGKYITLRSACKEFS